MEHIFDVVVVGSGAGALLAAVRAADEGLSVLVVEKADLLGGTSATSGGGIWIPDNHDMARVGLRDSIEAAFTYVKACAKGLSSDERVLAYVETARHMARYLDQIGVHYRSMPKYADYYPAMAGAHAGRAHHGSGRLRCRQTGRRGARPAAQQQPWTTDPRPHDHERLRCPHRAVARAHGQAQADVDHAALCARLSVAPQDHPRPPDDRRPGAAGRAVHRAARAQGAGSG